MKKETEMMGRLFDKHKLGKVRAVGGCVRDYVIGVPCVDIDFATTATPEDMLKLDNVDGWRVLPTGIDHGTVTFMSLFGSFEVTTLRRDIETDGRHAEVEFTQDWKADAARRDFTMNAMYWDHEEGLLDFFGGYDDAINGIVKFVGIASDRIKEDYLRMVRWCRFQARFGGKSKYADEINRLGTIELIRKHAENLEKISVERVWSEFKKAHAADHLSEFVDLMISCDLFDDEKFSLTFDGHIDFSSKFPLTTILGAWMGCDTAYFSSQFKLSRIEAFDMALTQKLFKEYSRKKEVDYRKLQHAGFSATQVKMLATSRLEDNEQLFALLDTPLERFPINGNDLIAEGVPAGPGIGETLFLLKEMWLNSNYEMTQDELLNCARKMNV